jgi:hypothetical protein
MQDLFQSISFNDKDLLNEWNKDYKFKFLTILDSDDFMKDKPENLLQTLVVIITKTVSGYDVDSIEYSELEPVFLDIFRTVANELTKDDLSYSNINKFIGKHSNLVSFIRILFKISTHLRTVSLDLKYARKNNFVQNLRTWSFVFLVKRP